MEEKLIHPMDFHAILNTKGISDILLRQDGRVEYPIGKTLYRITVNTEIISDEGKRLWEECAASKGKEQESN